MDQSKALPAMTIEKLEKLKDDLYRSMAIKPGLLGGAADSHMSDALVYGAALYNPNFDGQAQGRANRKVFSNNAMQAMICSRMGWSGIAAAPFREINCARLTDAEAVVFLIHNNEPLVIRDDLGLFPSDALVTQLRILMG